MKRIFVAVIIAAALFLSSCATIVSKSSYPVSFNTSPSDAKVSIVDKKGITIFNGRTPATVDLKANAGFFSKAKYTVLFEKEGYEARKFPIEASIDGWYFGNIIFGGLIGLLIIDPASGAMFKINNDFIEANLHSLESSVNGQLNIMDINEIPEKWQKHLVQVKE